MDAQDKALAINLLGMLEKYETHINGTNLPVDEVYLKMNFIVEMKEFLRWITKQKTTVSPEEFANARDSINRGHYSKRY